MNCNPSIAARSARAARTRCPRILCIDDDPDILRTIELHLRSVDVEVLRAGHGTHGFREALFKQPDVIITDLRMPQGSGDYLIECLKRNKATRLIPVIVLTGRRDFRLQSYLKRLGIVRYFTKPVPFSVLRAELERHVPLVPRDEDAVESPETVQSQAGD